MPDDTKSINEIFYDLGVALAKMSQSFGEMDLALWQGIHSVCKFRDKITRRQQLASWILDTAEQFADWVAGESE